jgi:uncharacterized protein
MKFRRQKVLPAVVLLMLATSSAYDPSPVCTDAADGTTHATYISPVLKELPLGTVKPQGWLLHQLQIMRDGTSGHLDEVYSKVKNSNGWLGGTGDGWEETPYWLDGAVPLAWLLDDKALQKKVLQYINWTLDHQRPSGYFGPLTKSEREKGTSLEAERCGEGEDWWPKMLMLKVMQQYYTATSDPRVIPFMKKYFAYQQQALQNCPLEKWTEWAESRGSENILMAQWLYGITREVSLLKLSEMLDAQSFPWAEWLGNRNWVIHAAAFQNEENWMHRHGVNVGMAIKVPALSYQRTGDPTYLLKLRTGFNDLMTLHGLPMGVFSADEDLHGNDPVQGTELCAIVESMFSLEQAIAITGDVQYMDALERIAYNALPTQTTDDYNAKQYFQIANQVQVKRGVFSFGLPFSREMTNVFGMRSGYTCCLANMHQGWTKFATHLWYGTPSRGLTAVEYAPCEITATAGIDNKKVTIKEVTTYPFEEDVRFEIVTDGEVEFPLSFRIPGWCSEATILLNGQMIRQEQGGNIALIIRNWKNGDKITLHLPMNVRISEWGRNSRAVERGPLVYALKLQERWEQGQEKTEGDYWCVYPQGAWNYGLQQQAVQKPIDFIRVREVQPVANDFIWNLAHAPLELSVSARKIPSWQLAGDVAPLPVTDRHGLYKGMVSDSVENITLIPYGCSKVRIVAFPVVP